MKLIYIVADTVLKNFKKQDFYDQMSKKYLDSGIFAFILNIFNNFSDITIP